MALAGELPDSGRLAGAVVMHDDMADMMTQAAWLLQANWPTVIVSTVYL